MKNTPHLTVGFAPELARQITLTVPGMAHFAAGGPFGTSCSDCVAYGYWRQNRNAAGNVVGTKFRKGCCAKFHKLTGQHGPPIPPRTEACRHFVRRGQ